MALIIHMLFPVIIVAKNLYFVNSRKSAHPVMNAINVATRFFALNCLADVAVALNAVVCDGNVEMELALLILLLTCLKLGDVDTRTWFVLMERCGGKLVGEKATAADAKKRYGSADFILELSGVLDCITVAEAIFNDYARAAAAGLHLSCTWHLAWRSVYELMARLHA